MFTLTGDFGKAMFESQITTGGTVTANLLSLNTEASLNFFKKISILKTNIAKNSLGLYSFARAGRNGKVRFASLTTPRHLFQSRKSCVWRDKGKISMNSSEFTLSPIEYMGSQCPDSLYGCMEGIFGTGNQVKNILGTAEGMGFFSQFLDRVYMGLGNSFYDLVSWGQHELITEADAGDWYTVNDEEWDAYTDQQENVSGHMALVDDLKTEGLTNFCIPINLANISADRNSYIGTVTDLFDEVLDAESPELKLAATSSLDASLKSILLVDKRLFKKYEDELITQWGNIPATLAYFMNGAFCKELGCISTEAVPGMLKYNGHVVVRMDEWESFDTMVGVRTFRCMSVAPGVFGIGYDIDSIDQTSGFGLQVTQQMLAPFKGKVFMDTTFKVGTGILDENFIVNASLVFKPAA